MGSSCCSSTSGNRLSTYLVVIGMTTVVMIGVVVYALNPRPMTDAQKAASQITKTLQTDEIARQNGLESGFERGPLDAKPDPWRGDRANEELTPQQMKDAAAIVTALTEADLDKLQSIIVSYKGKPYARAQIAASLSYTFSLTEAKFHFYTHEQWFYIGRDRLKEGDNTLVLSVLGDKATVLLTTEDRNQKGVFHQNDVYLDPHVVLRSFQRDIVGSVLKLQTAAASTKK
jgi:hypothetical protein